MNISAKTKIIDALNANPVVSAVFEKYKLKCARCGGAAAETLAVCARTHGLEPEMLVAEIKKAIESGPEPNGR